MYKILRRPLYSSFSPLDITSIVYGFEADDKAYNDAGTTLATDGQTVQQWNDKSTNARNLSQATSGSRPIYRATGGPNSKPALEFDGTDDEISRGAAGLGNAPHTVFFVAMPDVTNATRVVLNDNNMKWGQGGTSSNKLQFTTIFVIDYNGTTQQWTASTWGIYAVIFDTSYDANFYKNGSFIETIAGNADTSGNANLRIGGRGTEYWDGKISAVYAFSEALSSTNMTNMWTYLNNKYAVY